MALILGIDPGSHHTGFGIVEKGASSISLIKLGTISAKTALSFEDRMLVIGNELAELMQEFKPQTVVIEDIFTAKNIRSSLQLAHVRGLVMYLAKRAGAQVQSYPTKSVKKGITGNGNALKDQVAVVLQGLLNTNISGEKFDATDALALAYYHATKLEILEKFGAYQQI
jgi:crossover junction endodeoxyribonuclease RuvC